MGSVPSEENTNQIELMNTEESHRILDASIRLEEEIRAADDRIVQELINQTPPWDSDQADIPPTQPQDNQRENPRKLIVELKKLESHTPVGTEDLIAPYRPTRYRNPSIIKAQHQYEEVRDQLIEHLEDFYKQQYERVDPNDLPHNVVNEKYGDIRENKNALDFHLHSPNLIQNDLTKKRRDLKVKSA